MPWLVKDAADGADNLFFVHVPRCGGTSLMHHFDVPHKVMQGRSWWGRLGMRLFFYRYKLLESANFPLFAPGNIPFAASVLLSLKTLILGPKEYKNTALVAGSVSSVFLFSLCFVFTAPTIGRITYVRRSFLILVHYVCFRFMESIDWCTGTNKTGYMMHLTADKLLTYGYITPEQMDTVSSMAIVRNPYSRMVSIYMYNRFGPAESFLHFCKDWHDNTIRFYRERGEKEEWWSPCHCLPQYEYTHINGCQIVQAVVKQEELKFLKTKEDEHLAIAEDSTVADLPDVVRNALLGMPRTNSRMTDKKWYDYYDQETLDLVYKMYKKDFAVFKYSPTLSQRPDLKAPPAAVVEETRFVVDTFLRDSFRSSTASRRARTDSMLMSSRRLTSLTELMNEEDDDGEPTM